MRYDKEVAKKAGVPTWLRRYSRRYGKGSFHLLQTHKQLDSVARVARLDAIKVSPLVTREIVEGIVNA